ncbi:putative major facilitator superfamily transporter protein [Botrytis cinerea BcDW1]|uniref:Putative major facilitator superfamily transporter protein n=1 Tax=Botryotinia fuckeliana (strain BcDW1) TaxID=1290391 RepID=M7TPZ9_BOTF1|nr:putative major facilitator superfamily transporter protein [Botrytis cinerea BcDW1]
MSPHTSLINEREPLLAPLTEPTEVQDALITGSQVYQAVGSNRDGEGGEEHIGDEDEEDDDTPLPLGQILGLCYVRLVEPVAFFSVFAFLNQMLWEIGDIGEGEVGFYSGLIESLFSVTEMFLMVHWGRASDKFGRKPIMIISLLGISFATGIFGFGRSIGQLIMFRCIAGLFAGTIVTIRTMISENSTKKTQARAFSYFSVAGNLGILFGPMIGGAMSEPAKQYPSLFGGVKFFEEFPFALPTICTGLFALSSTLVATFYIKETLGKKKYQKVGARDGMSMKELLKFPGVARSCGQLALNDIAPSSETLGTLNSIALAVTSGTRAFVPALFTIIFAYGVTHQILWGYFIWVFEISVAIGLVIAVPFLPKEAYGRGKK